MKIHQKWTILSFLALKYNNYDWVQGLALKYIEIIGVEFGI